jgi:hypothetical protein
MSMINGNFKIFQTNFHNNKENINDLHYLHAS